MNFTEFCIKRPVFTTVLSLLIIVVGIVGFTRIPVRGYPNVNPPVITISTTFNGASATVMESQVTTPIENDLVGTNGLREMHSYSAQGRSWVVLKYKLDVDINAAVSDVRNRLARVLKQLPIGTDPPVIQKRDPNSVQTIELALTDKRLSRMELTDYANRNIVPAFEQVLGVANVDLFNDREYAMKILLNPAQMAANRVTVNDLTNVLKAQNMNVPSGQIKTPDRYYGVLSQGQLNSAKAFHDLIIRDEAGYLLRFGDVAKVVVAAEDTDSAMRVNGHSAIGLSIYSVATANPMKVAARVKDALHLLQDSFPEGMELRVVWDNTTFLKAALQDVYEDLAFAVLLVIVVVTLFLGSWRSAFIPIVTIPICLIGGCALVYAMGYSINIFTLLAFVLAIGLVVDDAIVMLENVYRHIEQGMPPLEAAIMGSKEIAFAIIAMTITLAAVYAPIGFSTGLTGVIFKQFAFTLALTVLISGFIALTLSPMMCAKLLKRPSEGSGLGYRYGVWLEKFFRRLMLAYQRLLNSLLAHRWQVIVFLLLVAGAGFWCYQHLPSNLEPADDTGAFIVSIDPPANSSFAYTDRYAKEVEAILQKLPGMDRVMMTVRQGRGAFGFAILKPWSERKESSQQVMQEFLTRSRDIAGVKITAFNMSNIGGGGKYGDAVRMVITTDSSFIALHRVVGNFLDAIRMNPAVHNAEQDLQMNSQQYIVHINRSLAAALHVNMADVSDTLRTMLGGAKVTQFNWNDRDYDVILQIPEHDLGQLDVINQLYVRNSEGKMIPLASIARVTTQVAPEQLPHEGRLRADTITVSINKGYSMGQVISYLQQAGKQYLPNGYTFHFKGVARNLLESKHTMMGSFALAIIFIYLVLAAQFESFIDPFIILLTVPLSIVGALFTLKLTNNTMSIYTNIGFVTLIGLIAKHGILITEFANQLRAQGKEFQEALIMAASLRLRPILMTTAAMVIGAIPLALATGAGALGREQIGWVIVGGLLFGTFFSLLVVPVAYSYLGKYKKRLKPTLSA